MLLLSSLKGFKIQKDRNMQNYKPRPPPSMRRVNLDLSAPAHPTLIEKARDSGNEVVKRVCVAV